MTHEELLAKIDHMWDDDFDYVIEQNRKALRAVVELCKPNEDDTYKMISSLEILEAIEKELG